MEVDFPSTWIATEAAESFLGTKRYQMHQECSLRMGEQEKISRTLTVYIYCGKSYPGLLGRIIGKCEVVAASHSGNCSCWDAELSPETREVFGSMQAQ